MISNLLSRLFLFGAWLTGIFGLVAVTTQLRQEPLRIRTGGSSYLSIGGMPGYPIKAFRNDARFIPADDTLVKYMVLDSNGEMRSSGSFRTSNTHPYARKYFEEARAVGPGEKINIDTTIYQVSDNDDVMSMMQYGYPKELLKDSSMLLTVSTEKDRRSTRRFESLHGHPITSIHRFAEGAPVVATLRMYPKDTGERLLFILATLLTWGSLTLLLFKLSRLFRDITNRIQFDMKNVRRLFQCGWLLLIPQVTGWAVYWLLTAHIRPVKYMVGGAFSDLYQYSFDIQPETDMNMVFLSLGLMVLAAVFREGYRLSSKESLTI